MSRTIGSTEHKRPEKYASLANMSIILEKERRFTFEKQKLCSVYGTGSLADDDLLQESGLTHQSTPDSSVMVTTKTVALQCQRLQ